MDNIYTNDLIEQYLNGALPPDEHQALEARMAADPVFRADVELHGQLQEEFADPKKLRLRDLISDNVREQHTPASSRYRCRASHRPG